MKYRECPCHPLKISMSSPSPQQQLGATLMRWKTAKQNWRRYCHEVWQVDNWTAYAINWKTGQSSTSSLRASSSMQWDSCSFIFWYLGSASSSMRRSLSRAALPLRSLNRSKIHNGWPSVWSIEKTLSVQRQTLRCQTKGFWTRSFWTRKILNLELALEGFWKFEINNIFE